MLSRYSVLPQQQVINTYVAPDLRYLAAAGQARQGAYDEGLAFNQAIEDKYSKVQTRDVDIARKNELVNQYTAEAQKIIEDNDGDVGRALPTLRKHASTYAGNPFWNHAENALKQYTDMQEANKRITEKGGSALTFNDDAAKQAVYNADGTYNTPSYELQTALDYTEPKTKLMNDIAKDTRLSGLGQSQIAGILQSGKFTGVTGKKVEAVAQQMLLPYLGTDAGRQEVRVLQRAGYSDTQIQQRLIKSLAGIGSKQVGMTADDSYIQDPLALFSLKMKLKAEQDAKTLQLSEGQTGATVNPLEGSKLELDDKGKVYVGGSEAYDPEGAEVGGYTRDTPKDYEAGNKQLEDIRQNYKRLHPNDALPKDKDLAELHNKAIDNSRLVAPKTYEMTPKAADIASKQLLGVNYKKGDISNLQGRQIVMLGTKGEMASQPITLEKALEQMGVKADDAHKITSAQVTGPLRENPLIAGGYHVTVTAGGKSYELAISGPKQRQDYMQQIQPLINSAYTGKTGRAQVGSVHFKSISAPKKDGSGFETQVRGYEEVGGKLVPLREREADGKTIKKDKQGRTVYAPYQSLSNFTDDQEKVFQKVHGDLFNVSGATNKELDDDPDL